MNAPDRRRVVLGLALVAIAVAALLVAALGGPRDQPLVVAVSATPTSSPAAPTATATPTPTPTNAIPTLPAALTTRAIEVHPLADLLVGKVAPVRESAVVDAWNGFTISADGERAMLYRERGPQAGPPPSIVDLKSGARTVLQLVNDPLNFFAFAGWLPDGRVLIVGKKVWIGAADGSALREVADAVDLAGNVPWVALPSPSGRYLALWGYNSNGSLGFVDLQTGATKRVTGPFRRHGADASVALAWSPDEKLLAGSDADGEFVEANRRLRIVDPFSDATIRMHAIATVKIWWLATGDLLVLLPTGETGAGARFAGALLDPSSFVERRRFLGINWYPSPDGRYLLQINPSQGLVVTELFDLRSASTSIPLRFEGGPVGWTTRNDLIIRR